MSNFLLNAHSGLRYLILLGGVLTVLYAAFGVAARRPYDKPMRILASSFVGTMHLQILLGLALLFSGRFQPALTGHIFMMLFAAAAAQIPVSVMRRRPEEQKSYLPHGIGALAALAMIAAGILAIGRPIVG
jgi:heme A synthase